MPKVSPLDPSLISNVNYDEIKELATLNFAPSDIAIRLGFNKYAFVALWRNKESKLYQSYKKGLLDKRYKEKAALLDEVEDGNVIAMQMLNKEAEAQAFEDIKTHFFGDE